MSYEQLWGDMKEVLDERYGKTPRQLMQAFGTDFVRKHVGDRFWISKFESWYSTGLSARVVVTDVRFQNEVDAIKTLGGRIIKLQRHAASDDDLHESEDVDALIGVDAVLDNNASLEQLSCAVCSLMKTW